MTGLTPVLRLWSEAVRRMRVAGFRWALAEMPPLHPDVPFVVRRLNELSRSHQCLR